MKPNSTPSKSGARSRRGDLLINAAADHMNTCKPKLFKKTLNYLPHLVIADSTIPKGGDGLFVQGPITIPKDTVICMYDGDICYTEHLEKFAAFKKIPLDECRAYTVSLGSAQSKSGQVIVGCGVWKNYYTQGPASFINYSAKPNVRFDTSDSSGVVVKTRYDISLEKDEVLELFVCYEKTFASHPELAALNPNALKVESKPIQRNLLKNIKSVGGKPYTGVEFENAPLEDASSSGDDVATENFSITTPSSIASNVTTEKQTESSSPAFLNQESSRVFPALPDIVPENVSQSEQAMSLVTAEHPSVPENELDMWMFGLGEFMSEDELELLEHDPTLTRIYSSPSVATSQQVQSLEPVSDVSAPTSLAVTQTYPTPEVLQESVMETFPLTTEQPTPTSGPEQELDEEEAACVPMPHELTCVSEQTLMDSELPVLLSMVAPTQTREVLTEEEPPPLIPVYALRPRSHLTPAFFPACVIQNRAQSSSTSTGIVSEDVLPSFLPIQNDDRKRLNTNQENGSAKRNRSQVSKAIAARLIDLIAKREIEQAHELLQEDSGCLHTEVEIEMNSGRFLTTPMNYIDQLAEQERAVWTLLISIDQMSNASSFGELQAVYLKPLLNILQKLDAPSQGMALS